MCKQINRAKKGNDIMQALQSEPEIITLEQYETLPENERIEIFDGIAYNMASPSETHQTISTELTTILNTYIKNKKGSCKVFHAPFDVIFSLDLQSNIHVPQHFYNNIIYVYNHLLDY